MKHLKLTFLLTMLMSMVGATALAHDIEVQNTQGKTIYYKWTNNNTELAVSYRGIYSSVYSNEYSGNVVIPGSVTYNGKKYSVTSIDSGAFEYCESLTSVTIPNSVTFIWGSAFSGCIGLTAVTINSNSILSKAYLKDIFGNQVKKYIIGNSVTSIGSNAFNGCTGLTAVTIPKSVTSIGDWAFKGCTGLTDVTIPNSVTSIGRNAFENCSGLTAVYIPNSVTSIGSNAFNGCTGLTAITIPESVESIGLNAFLETAWFDNQPNGVVYAGKVAYKYKGTMPANTSITLKEGTLGIADDAFSYCSGLTAVTIPKNVESIGSSAFSGCSGLTSITIPESVTSIGNGAFSGCSGLTSIKVVSGNTMYDSRNNCNAIIETASNTLINGCSNTIIPNSVESIGKSAFSGCRGLTSVTIPNSVTSIGNSAFYGCDDLISVTIPNSVTSIGDHAFDGCSGLTSVTIPSSVTSIGTYAFRYCYRLGKVVVKDIDAWCKIQFQDFYSNPLYYAHHLYRDNNTEITNVVIHESVTSIGNYAFEGFSSLTSITIPNSVTSIGRYAFFGCSGLTSVTIPNSVTSIGDYAFSGCSSLTSVTIPKNVESIGSSAFSGCSKLTAVTIPNSVKYIWKGTFQDCTSLTAVTIGNSVTYIGDYAFKGCSSLTSVTIPNSVTNIFSEAFQDCSGLTSVIIGNSVRSIQEYAFSGCSSLTAVTVMNPSPVYIQSSTFSNRANATLYVPIGSKAAYEAANYWKEFKEIVEIYLRKEQTLALLEIPILIVGDAPYELPATTNEGLALSWSVGNNRIAEITEGKLSAKAVGKTTVTATQAGNDKYLPFTREYTLTVKEFGVTDISKLDNVIYMDETEVRTGGEATLSLKMKNTAPIRGFQFDLYLPNGLTVVKSSKGKIQGALCPDRLPDEDEHDLTFSEQPDGAIRFLCTDLYDETFTGNDGEIATLKVNVAADMTDGEYPIQLKNIKLTETNISKYYTAELIQSKLIAVTYMTGDINNDGVVDVSDYTGIANHIHGNTPEGFNAIAADVDKNGTVDVSDYTGIANIIHTGSIYGNSSNSARATGNQPTADWDAKDNVIFIAPFTATAGTKTAISIEMKNTAAIRGFQFDLYLPEGMTVVKSAKGKIQGKLSEGRLPDEDEHDLTFSQQPDGAIRILCSSQYDETFTGTSGELATLQVEIASNMANGDHAIQLKNMKLTETDISKYYTSDLIESTVTIEGGATTGINSLTSDPSAKGEESGNTYSLDGRKVSNSGLSKGIYIKNGKKVVIK